jgi:hypothetical protein
MGLHMCHVTGLQQVLQGLVRMCQLVGNLCGGWQHLDAFEAFCGCCSPTEVPKALATSLAPIP